MYALISAHLAHLIWNWSNDSLVLRQRVNCIGAGNLKNDVGTHKPPHVLPASRYVRWFRLIAALLVLIVTLKFDYGDKPDDMHVSHTTHAFGALAGLTTGCIFLKARSSIRIVHTLKVVLLMFVYSFPICYIITEYYKAHYESHEKVCPWIEYERVCQNQCYLKIQSGQGTNCTVNLCN